MKFILEIYLILLPGYELLWKDYFFRDYDAYKFLEVSGHTLLLDPVWCVFSGIYTYSYCFFRMQDRMVLIIHCSVFISSKKKSKLPV